VGPYRAKYKDRAPPAHLRNCIISEYKSKHVSWYETFAFVSDEAAAEWPENFISRQQAQQLAELHREQMNLQHNCAVAFWRYVQPQHVEVRFPVQQHSTMIVERSYWESVRHAGHFKFHRYSRKREGSLSINIMIEYTDTLSNVRIDRSVAAHQLNTQPPLQVYAKDGDSFHLCKNNLRVRNTAARAAAVREFQNIQPVISEKCGRRVWRVLACKLFLIPDDQDPNEIPDYIRNCLHKKIVVERPGRIERRRFGIAKSISTWPT
jgi:hypothetical protein